MCASKAEGKGSVSQGFTLIEIVIVILLLSLILGLVSPTIINSIQRSKLNKVGSDLVAAIRYTRAQALIKNEEQGITFDLAESTYQIPVKNKVVNVPKLFDMKLITAATESDSDTTGTIRFFPDGSSTGGRITLKGENKTWVVNIAWLTGNVELIRQ